MVCLLWQNLKKDETELEEKTIEPVPNLDNRVADDSKKASFDEQSSKPKRRKWRFLNLFCAKYVSGYCNISIWKCIDRAPIELVYTA